MKTKAEGPTLRTLTGCGFAEGNSTFSLFMDNKIRWWTMLTIQSTPAENQLHNKVVSMCNPYIEDY